MKKNEKEDRWVDISGYNVSNPVRQVGEVFPYTFYQGFQSYRYEKHELEAACPKCGNKQTVCLGSYLSCDCFYNVFTCMDCLIAWDVEDQPGGYSPGYVDRVEALVRTLYDPDFTPMSLRDGDRVICRVCGRLSFYQGYTTCPMCYGKPLEKPAPEEVGPAMKRMRQEAA